jgi:Rieske Fe-S protein
VAAIGGREHPWASFFDPYRLTPLRSAKGVLAEGSKDARHLVGDRLRGAEDGAPADLAPGEARILRVDGKLTGAYRDEDGSLHAVSPTCTHLGCRLGWNTAERSWDCPCHGSRFAPDGTVLQGPAVAPLDRRDV